MVALMLLSVAASCGSARSSVTARAVGSSYRSTVPSRNVSGSSSAISNKIDINPSLTPTASAILAEANSWIGTSYLYGGNDRNGVDCSGLVVQVFGKVMNLKLPRTSIQQQQYCRQINRTELVEGDLVFFRTRGSADVGHVGIYIGNDRMVHASSSKGVVVSELSLPYYQENFYGAGRIDSYFAALQRESSLKTKPVETVQPHRTLASSQPRTVASATAKKPLTPVRLAPTVVSERPADIAAKVAEAVSVQVEQSQPAGQSGLEELSEFFD